MKILVLANNDVGLYNFRKELLQTLISDNHEVTVSLPIGNKVKELEKIGCVFVNTWIDRRGRNPFCDVILFFEYCKLMYSLKPDVVITYTIKPNIYGGIAARFNKIPTIGYIAGLGTPMQKKNLQSRILTLMYKEALKKARTVFFENEGSLAYFIKNKMIGTQYVKIPGAGVNLSEFSYSEYPVNNSPVKFLFIGRIMREKGIEEILHCAKKIKECHLDAVIELLGDYEENYKNKIDLYCRDRYINYYGFQEDVKPYIKNAHCIILPSYHEGMANVLLESAAIGRPLITSNIQGCKEVVDDKQNGFLVNAKDEFDLLEKLKKFVFLSYVDKKIMGKKSREIVESRFDRSITTEMMISAIRKIHVS